jgi:membrane protease subunit HflK
MPDVPNQPAGTLYQTLESAVREAVGKSQMDFVLSEGRAEIAQSTRDLMQEILDDYETGLEVTTVNLEQAQPPEAVQGAFADAIKAREDEVRFRNEAEAYANSKIPEARGQSARIIEEATAYRDRVIAQAEGEADRFTQLLTEYELAPQVTRERLYLDAVESVLANSNKVMVDVDGGNNLLYLPLDRLVQDRARPGLSQEMDRNNSGLPSQGSMINDDLRRRSERTREGR